MEELCLLKTLYLRGKASQLAFWTFNNSPRTRLVALKCGFCLGVGDNWRTWHPASPAEHIAA